MATNKKLQEKKEQAQAKKWAKNIKLVNKCQNYFEHMKGK